MLETRNVSVLYGRHRALENVSAMVSKGEIVVMLGANGAGKSTFIRAIAGQTRKMDGGSVLMEAGRRLARPQIEVLAAAGVAAVRIRAPRLRLVRVGQSGDAFIDSAFACVADAIGARGGVAVTTKPDGLAHALVDPAVDAIVVVGGTGSGRSDATVRTLASMGEVYVHGVALLPGETTAFGAIGSRPVLALPGRLDAALAAWHLLGQVMLARLAGSREP